MIGSWLVSVMENEFVKKFQAVTLVVISGYVFRVILSHLIARVMQFKAKISSLKKDKLTISKYVQRVQTLHLATNLCFI